MITYTATVAATIINSKTPPDDPPAISVTITTNMNIHQLSTARHHLMILHQLALL